MMHFKPHSQNLSVNFLNFQGFPSGSLNLTYESNKPTAVVDDPVAPEVPSPVAEVSINLVH